MFAMEEIINSQIIMTPFFFFFSQIPSSYDVILEDTEKVIRVLKPICKAFDKTAAKSGI